MKARVSIVGVWISVLFGLFSLVTMISAFQIDTIVNQDLYNYGLQLSNSWALPYWTAKGQSDEDEPGKSLVGLFGRLVYW